MLKFYTVDCMMLIAGEGNDGQGLLPTAEITVSSPAIIPVI